MEGEKRGTVRFVSLRLCHCANTIGRVMCELANLVERMAIIPNGVVGVSELPKRFRYLEEDDGIQELRDEISERAALLAVSDETPVGAAELPSDGLDLREYLAEMEQDLIQQALDAEDGVVARAAERLNVRRTTLVEKMRKYGMSRN